MDTGLTIITEARGLLNDPTGAIFKTDPMIVLANKVYRELQTKLSAMGIAVTKKDSTLSVLTAGDSVLTSGSGLPNDLLYPIEVRERLYPSADRYADMQEKDWKELDVTPRTFLGYWVWQEDELKFPVATTDRQLHIRFVKTLGSITQTTSPIQMAGVSTWLSQRLASLSALVIGANQTRADALALDLVTIWDDLKATLVKRKQSIPVRRMRTRYRVP